MQKRRTWMVAPLVALLLNLIAGAATADPIGVDPVPVIVTTDATVPSTTITSTTTTTVTATTAPSVTTTTGTTVPSTTVQVPLPTPTPIIQIITTQPITIDTTTVVAPTTSTPLGGSIVVGGPGTTGSVPITTTVVPIGSIILQPLPDVIVVVPTVTGSITAPIVTTGTGSIVGNVITGTGVIQTGGTGASATVTEPANGIAVNASAFAAVCLLADAIGRTTLDPAATVYLSTLCSGSASTAGGTASVTAGQLASTSVDLAASICLVANALVLPSPLTTEYLASAGLDTRCGTGPTTAVLDSTTTVLNNVTVNPSGAVAVCLIASALAGLPTTADLSTACGDAAGGGSGPTPSVVTGGLPITTPVGDVTPQLAVALCVVAHAVADLPTTAALTTPCATSQAPSTAAPVSGAPPVLGVEAGPGDDIGSINQILEPSSGVQDTQTSSRNDNVLVGILGQLGITSLPGTSTVLGGGLLGFALIGLGVAFLRRRQGATN